jgi:hypothetical protein
MSRDRFLATIALALLRQGAAIGQESSASVAKIFAPGVISGPDTDMGGTTWKSSSLRAGNI